MTKVALTVFSLVVSATVFAAEADHRFVRLFKFPAALESAVVAEGDLEPRSIGSYTLRIYGGGSSQFPTDDFITGIVRPRDGTIEAVHFIDMDGDNRAVLVVLMRSAGSGGYLAADAFRYRKGSLELIAAVSNLDKAADPIEALRNKMKMSVEKE